MKVLKYIGIGLLAIVLLFLILGFFAPKHTKVERSIVIAATKQQVMDQVKSLKNMQKWSPWADLDPNMKNVFEGTDGEVGSKNSWEGNSDVGKGSQTITSVADDRVEASLEFIEPFESKAKVYYNIKEEKEGTSVTWGFEQDNSYPMNAMLLFMDMDAMLGKDFEKGLGRLKKVCEEMPKAEATPAYEIHEQTLEAKSYVGKREMIGFMDFEKFYGTNFQAIMKALGESKIQPAGPLCGVYYSWDEKNMKADVMAAAPVADAKTSVKGFTTITIPAGKALHVAYYGDYAKSKAAHEAIDAYMKEKNMEMAGNVIEEYVTDPMTEKDTTKWLTNIYYMVK